MRFKAVKLVVELYWVTFLITGSVFIRICCGSGYILVSIFLSGELNNKDTCKISSPMSTKTTGTNASSNSCEYYRLNKIHLF